ncbi:ThiF family adenylyltransferase [Roseobacter sp. S98]|uniref:ThiF family adenylyltransferase n=1 Tax=Roseobacter algicola (ex Choi et al. 2025) (nom. illeg.) TaxID=3092138 RepID=UPI003F511F78
MTASLTLTENHHAELRHYLFPRDGLESAAILICRFVGPERERMIVREILNVPDTSCPVRKCNYISWPGESIEDAIDAAEADGDAIILIHSHPSGFYGFSETDNASDRITIPSLFAAIETTGYRHGSAIMTPNGAMKVRLYNVVGEVRDIETIWCVGENITDLTKNDQAPALPFGHQMTDALACCTACVIGVSGTGSLVAELLARKGVGHLIFVDFDIIKHKNLNRIVNSTVEDAEARQLKTRMMAAAIELYAPNTKITIISAGLETREAVIAASAADILFSCVDGMTGRSIAELICRRCLIPLIDLGVTIPTRRDNEDMVHVADVCGRIDFVRPDGPNLSDRGVVTAEGLRAEYLMATAPNAAAQEIEAGYIQGAHEEAPSVMALNMKAAADAVLEWIARQFPYRLDDNSGCARTLFSHAAGELDLIAEEDFKTEETGDLALGLVEPLLGLPSLAPINVRDAA